MIIKNVTIGVCVGFLLATPAYSLDTLPVATGETLMFVPSDGVPLGIIKFCGGITSACEAASYALDGRLSGAILVGLGIDQYASISGGRQFSFIIEEASDELKACASNTVPVSISGATEYFVEVDQTPSFIPTEVNVSLKNGMMVFPRDQAIPFRPSISSPFGQPPNSTTTEAFKTPTNAVLILDDQKGTSNLGLTLNLKRGVPYTVVLDSLVSVGCASCSNAAADFLAEAAGGNEGGGIFYKSVTIDVGTDPSEITCALKQTVDMIKSSIESLDVKVDALSSQIVIVDEKVTLIDSKVDDLKNQLDNHDADIKSLLNLLSTDVNRNYIAIQDTIRLLHTPQGNRTSEIPACNGAACDFPNKK